MVYNTRTYFVFWTLSIAGIQKKIKKNKMFRKLNLFPSSNEGVGRKHKFPKL
jgi:hypothetical protein